MEMWVIPLGALIVSLFTLMFGAVSLRDKATAAHANGLERRFDRVESDLRDCVQERSRLERENLRLMRELLKASGIEVSS